MDSKAPVGAQKGKGSSPREVRGNSPDPGEKVELSPEARKLSEARGEDPAAAQRSRHLARIKKEVQQGTYQVRGKEIAEKLLKTMLKERDTLK